MVDIIIKYFFQNDIDTGFNHLFLNKSKYNVTTVQEIKEFMLSKNLIQKNCYLRFKDYINGEFCWVDIMNDEAPLPFNNKREVEVKVLRVPYDAIS